MFLIKFQEYFKKCIRVPGPLSTFVSTCQHCQLGCVKTRSLPENNCLSGPTVFIKRECHISVFDRHY